MSTDQPIRTSVNDEDPKLNLDGDVMAVGTTEKKEWTTKNLLSIDRVPYLNGNKYTAFAYKTQNPNQRKSALVENLNTRAYLISHQFGNEEIDSNDEDDPALVGRDRDTQKRLKSEAIMEEIKLLGPCSTAFSLFKGFVATGILYMPLNFVKSGWLFSSASLIMALFLTIFCTKQLLEARAAMGGKISFSEMGFKLLGNKGKYMVDITLVCSQFSFGCAYIFFIASNGVGIV